MFRPPSIGKTNILTNFGCRYSKCVPCDLIELKENDTIPLKKRPKTDKLKKCLKMGQHLQF